MPELFTPRYGRKAPHPESTHPRMHAASFLATGYTGVVPATVDWFSGVTFGMSLNDQIGDCTIADVAHAIGAFSKWGQGQEAMVPDADVLTMYERVGGYRPGDPSTDNGCVIQDVLNDWRKNGIGSPVHKILAFFSVNYSDAAELKACTWLFGGCTLGVNFPRSAMAQFNAGVPWDYDPNADNTIEGGHDVRLLGVSASGNYYVVTWGRVQMMTSAWLNRFVEEAWAQADEEWIKNNASPTGLDFAALDAAYTQVTKQPGPFTATTPPPGPTPAPPVVISVEQAAANASLAALARTYIKGRHWTAEAKAMQKELGFWLQAWNF